MPRVCAKTILHKNGFLENVQAVRDLAAKFPNFTPSQLLQATAASYNFGTNNISGNPSTIDVGTAPKGNGNYGSHVVNLMDCFH